MARYVNVLTTNRNPQEVYDQIVGFLAKEGYKQTEYKKGTGVMVFCKGSGALVAKSFMNIGVDGNAIQVSAWLRISILPGVHVGETGITGFYAAAVKAPLRGRVTVIEKMILS